MPTIPDGSCELEVAQLQAQTVATLRRRLSQALGQLAALRSENAQLREQYEALDDAIIDVIGHSTRDDVTGAGNQVVVMAYYQALSAARDAAYRALTQDSDKPALSPRRIEYQTEESEFPFGEFDNGRHWRGQAEGLLDDPICGAGASEVQS